LIRRYKFKGFYQNSKKLKNFNLRDTTGFPLFLQHFLQHTENIVIQIQQKQNTPADTVPL
jgi:hypothetical protein